MHNFSINLRYLRKRFSVSQTDIAKLVGKGQTTMTYWENGTTEPSMTDFIKISRYFGLSLDALILTDLETADIITDQHLKDFKSSRKNHPKTTGKIPPLTGKFTTEGTPIAKITNSDTIAILNGIKTVQTKLARIERLFKK